MKRILIISQNYYPEIGSAANRVKNIYKELKKLGHKVTVLTAEPSYPNRNLYKDPKFWNDPDFNNDVIRIRTRTRKYSHNIINRLLLYTEMTYKFIRTIRKLGRNYDFVLATTPAIFIGLAGLAAKRKLKCPFILDVRDLWPDSLIGVGVFNYKPIIKMAELLEKKLYMEAQHIIINSEGFKPHIKSKGISGDKISFIPNSLTKQELQNFDFAPKNREEKTVIYTGNIGLAQDLDILIDVAEKMKDNKKIKFQIIGYGYRSKELYKKIVDRNLPNIKLLSAANKVEVIKAIQNADIAFVSLVNNKVFDTVLPGKVIDYMSLGKPIIGSVSGYVATVIKMAKCGMVSEQRKVDEITEFILKLSSDSALAQQLGRNGYDYAVSHYEWTKNITVLSEILEKSHETENLHVRLEPLYK